MIVCSSPEPAVDIDGGQVRSVATFVLKIAFPPACVDGGHVVCNQKKTSETDSRQGCAS